MENGNDRWICPSFDGQPIAGSATLGLAAAGAEKVFAEKISGAVTERKALGRAISALGQGDVLLVTRLDRLARSTSPSYSAGLEFELTGVAQGVELA
jgi:DNA invertase Pin-like site-specific DNA recombinase